MTNHRDSRIRVIMDQQTARDLITAIEYYNDNHEYTDSISSDTEERLQTMRLRMIKELSR